MAISFTLFQKVFFPDSLLNQLQTNIENSLNSIFSKSIVGGLLVEDVALTTSFKNIPHGLGRPVKGYIVVKANALITVYDDEVNNSNKNLFVRLASSATVTASIWVF